MVGTGRPYTAGSSKLFIFISFILYLTVWGVGPVVTHQTTGLQACMLLLSSQLRVTSQRAAWTSRYACTAAAALTDMIGVALLCTITVYTIGSVPQ